MTIRQEPWRHLLYLSASTADTTSILTSLGTSTISAIALLIFLRSLPIRALKKNQDFKLGSDATQTYFLAHVLINATICVLTFPDVIRVVYNPILSGYNGDYDLMPTVIQVGFHVAHMVTDFRTLKTELWIHHILSSVLLGGFDLYFTYGPLLNFCLFFATGLPGGLNYAVQFARKIGLVRKSEADLFYAALDTWIRTPALTATMAFAHACWASGSMRVGTPGWVQVAQYVFTAGNGIYFGAQAVAVQAAGAAVISRPDRGDTDSAAAATAAAAAANDDDSKWRERPRAWARRLAHAPAAAFLCTVCALPYMTAYPRGTLTR